MGSLVFVVVVVVATGWLVLTVLGRVGKQRCTNCGSWVPKDAQVCAHCGSDKLALRMRG